jgi:hypothetical protein
MATALCQYYTCPILRMSACLMFAPWATHTSSCLYPNITYLSSLIAFCLSPHFLYFHVSEPRLNGLPGSLLYLLKFQSCEASLKCHPLCKTFTDYHLSLLMLITAIAIYYTLCLHLSENFSFVYIEEFYFLLYLTD